MYPGAGCFNFGKRRVSVCKQIAQIVQANLLAYVELQQHGDRTGKSHALPSFAAVL